MRKLNFLLSLPAFFITAASFAQTGTITGDISGSKELSGAVVTLLKAKDSSFYKTAFCSSEGKFEFELVKDGSYLIMITHTGYQKYYSNVFTIGVDKFLIQLPSIELKEAIKELQEVKVQAKKPFVERKIDRVVINPDALIGNAGTNSLEVLEKAPGILVDVNGIISLKGKQGVLVFIDDKPTYLSAADLAGYLRSLPAGSIESIEIMTNPPAKYDAAGNAGIVNIRLKKNRTKGWNGGMTLSYGQGRYHRSNNSFNLNYRINKFNFFTNISYNNNHSYQDLTINRFYFSPAGAYNSAFIQNSYIKKEQQSVNGRLGADYYINNQHTLGFTLSGFINPSFSPVTNKAKLLDSNNNIINLVEATNPSDKVWKNGSANINYAYKIGKKGKSLFANVDYIQYNSTHSQNLVNSIFTPANIFVGKTTLQSSLPANISIKTGKVDYTNPLKKGGKLDAGLKSSFVNSDNIADFFDVIGNTSSPNYQFSNRFRYQENINAAYINYAKDWKKISVQAGLRLENTNIRGNQLGNAIIKDSSFKRNYTNLFPTFYVAYRPDSTQTHQFGLSVGRRINRPNYQDLNPFTYPLDLYTYYGGNPFLQPTFAYSFEVSHTFKNKITTSVEYGIINNLIQETNEQRGTIYYSRPGNFGKQTVYGIDINANLQLAKWWTLILYTELKNLGYKSLIYGQVLDEKRFYWYIGPTNQFTITKNLSAELAGSYQTRILVAQFLTIPVWQMRAGISQKILKGKGSVRFNVSDLLYTNQPGGDIRNIANSKANWLSLLDSRVASFTFSYNFAKGKSLNARKSGASDDEKGRIKTN
jgi:iron complex outermembrane recepter protein